MKLTTQFFRKSASNNVLCPALLDPFSTGDQRAVYRTTRALLAAFLFTICTTASSVAQFTEQFAGSLDAVGYSSVAWGDDDNDGYLDILLTGYTGSAYVSKIYHNNAGSGFTEVFAGSLTGVRYSSVAWGDYDNDGYLDILLTGYTGTGSTCISKIYHNNAGSGFTEVFAGSLIASYDGSVAWGDYDNDGYLDILLTGHECVSGGISKIYHNNAGSGFTEVFAGSLTPVHQGSLAWGDYDNDGDLDILLTAALGANGPWVSKIYRNDGGVFNTVPSSPTGLSAAVAGTTATLTWNPATDAQTPQAGLTYNLRMGTSPNAINTLSWMANVSTGYRRVVRMGNANQVTSYSVKNLSPGTYYWCVQAIDTAFAGSPCAAEVSFSVGTPCYDSQNFVVNGSFEVTSPAVAPNSFNDSLDPTTGVPGWTTTGNFLEVWANTFGGIPASLGPNQLEINAQSDNQTVSQVVTGLDPKCPTTFCFDYTGRLDVVGSTPNNDFTVTLTGGYALSVPLDPAAYSVGGWLSFCTSFVPTTSTITIAFTGQPHFTDGTTATQGGAHIDNVSITQCCPCPPSPVLSVALSAGNIVLSWNGPGYRLECTTVLAGTATVWVSVPGTSPVTLSACCSKFFRLVCP
jgi:hypothetical protein